MILSGPAAGGVQFFSEDPQGLSGRGPQTRTQPLGRHAANYSTAARPNLAGSSWRTGPLLRDRYIYFTARVKFSTCYPREPSLRFLARDDHLNGMVVSLADDSDTLNFDEHSGLCEV
jgi:hypothetical protein